jgi:hypothetical protein
MYGLSCCETLALVKEAAASRLWTTGAFWSRGGSEVNSLIMAATIGEAIWASSAA